MIERATVFIKPSASRTETGFGLPSDLLEKSRRRVRMVGIVFICFGPALAVVFANFGSKVIYGLGIEAARARRLGSYELMRPLGQGGLGEVWLARHRLLVRPAAEGTPWSEAASLEWWSQHEPETVPDFAITDGLRPPIQFEAGHPGRT